MLMRCPAAASRRQGCDLEPQLETALPDDDDDDEEEELEMNCASVVTDTTQRRLSCTTVDRRTIGAYILDSRLLRELAQTDDSSIVMIYDLPGGEGRALGFPVNFVL